MSDHPRVQEETLQTWRDVLDAVSALAFEGWVFRGHDCGDWVLRTTLERYTRHEHKKLEREAFWHFVRSAPRLLPGHLVPAETDVAAWLGLIQHHGGPTRFLDVTRSPYVAVFFAFETPGEHDRALWAIDRTWCATECARTMADNEGVVLTTTLQRVFDAPSRLVEHLVIESRDLDPPFESMRSFSGVFPVAPWRPDSRQSAQQATFLCMANLRQSFMENLAVHSFTEDAALKKFVLPHTLRQEALAQLALMNVTAATLFPDLDGLARSLRTILFRRTSNPDPTSELRP